MSKKSDPVERGDELIDDIVAQLHTTPAVAVDVAAALAATRAAAAEFAKEGRPLFVLTSVFIHYGATLLAAQLGGPRAALMLRTVADIAERGGARRAPAEERSTDAGAVGLVN